MNDGMPEVADLGIHAPVVPAGTRCDEHIDVDAAFRCALCATHRCDACLWGKRGARAICRTCAKDGLPAPIAWERRHDIGVVRGFFGTVREVCFTPARFFRTPALENDAVGGFEHGLASFAVGQIALVLQGLILMATFGGALAIGTRAPAVLAVFGSYGCAMVAMIPVMMVHVPTTTLVSVGVAAAMIHGTLVVLGAAKAPFWAGTVRATSYSFATHVLFAVPIVGVPIALVWTLAIETIGVREVHRTGTPVAVTAVLGYRVLVIALVLTVYVLIGALVAGFVAARP